MILASSLKDRYFMVPWQKWLRSYELKAKVEGGR